MMFVKRVARSGVSLGIFCGQHNRLLCRSLGLGRRRAIPFAAKSSTGTTQNGTEIAGQTNDIFSSDNVSFGNTTTRQLIRSVMVLRICSLPGFASNALRVLQVTRKCLGKTMFACIMRSTVYGQFVAGNTTEEIRKTAEKLTECKLDTILAVPIEADVGDSDLSGEELLDSNLAKVFECVDISRDIQNGNKPSLMQVKFTALMDYDVLSKITVLHEKGTIDLKCFLDWMVNGCRDDNVIKSMLSGFSAQEWQTFASGIRRIMEVFEYAAQNSVYVLVDAEYTWINPALNLITIASMVIYNKKRPIVWNTYQAYLRETSDVIKEHQKICSDADVIFAFKLVRGAYLLQETQKAGGHPQWLCSDWNHTNENYNLCLRESVQMDPRSTEVLFATHNEKSVRLAAELLKQRSESGIGTSNVSFAQLFGMADYMGYTLAKMGYTVYKSVPYGSIEDTLQYLARRATENTLFLTGIRKDMDMLKKEIAKKVTRRKVKTLS